MGIVLGLYCRNIAAIVCDGQYDGVYSLVDNSRSAVIMSPGDRESKWK